MSEIIKYKLSDRPKWWLPRLFKFIGILTAILGLLAYLASLALYAQAEALYGDSDDWEKSSQVMLGSSMEELSTVLVDVLFIAVFLWLLAIAADKLDQLVWLNATDEDRSEIIQKRKKKKNAKNK